MAQRPPKDPVRRASRASKAQRQVGVGAKCACGESRPQALLPGTNPILCAECDRIERGASPFDAHHIAGRANSPVTVKVPANEHRAVLSPAQYDWPSATLNNPDGSPLLSAAGTLRGNADLLGSIIAPALEFVAMLLEALDQWLRNERGADYWKGTVFESWRFR